VYDFLIIFQSVTRSLFPRTDFFGLPVEDRLKDELNLLQSNDSDATILILSDIHLDAPIVWGKLQRLLEGYDETPPTVIFLIGMNAVLLCLSSHTHMRKGDFLSSKFGDEKNHFQLLSESFDRLARLFLRFTNIVKSSQVFYF
jgi:hypothetical protein